jgi:transcription elongation factor Elf1
LLRIYEKKSNPKKLKNKKLFGCLSCSKNKRVVVLIHNSTTIYPIDMRLVAP